MRAYKVHKEKHILQQIKAGDKILHIGCTNSPRTAERLKSGTLLHKNLCDKAEIIGADITGIDIDDEAINFLKSMMPNKEILNIDAHKCAEYFGENRTFDLIIAGDVIEHLPNPGVFLQSCKSVLSPHGNVFLTSVNAYSAVRFLKAIFSHEAVHDEHTAYYSHKTLQRLLYMCGLEGRDYGYYICEPLRVKFTFNRLISNFIEYSVCFFFPQFSEGLMVKASKMETHE